MSSDQGTFPEKGGEAPESLPAIVRARLIEVRLDRPLGLGGGRFVEPGAPALAVEVELGGAVPIRALGPVLHVGKTVLTEGEPVDELTYRFMTVDPDAIDPTAEVHLGWFGSPPPTDREPVRLEGGAR